jgi:hypothetical protein
VAPAPDKPPSEQFENHKQGLYEQNAEIIASTIPPNTVVLIAARRPRLRSQPRMG